MAPSSSPNSLASRILAEESFRGSKCGSSHRSLSDGSDYGPSAASSDLASITSGADASRYRRGRWVPLLVTRYGLGALIYADGRVLDGMTRDEDAEEGEVVKAEAKGEVKVEEDAKMSDVVGVSSKAAEEPAGEAEAEATPVEAEEASHEAAAEAAAEPPAGEDKPKEEAKESANAAAAPPNNNDGGSPKLSGLMLHVPGILLHDANLRASVCAAVLVYGMPLPSSEKKLWREVPGGILAGSAGRSNGSNGFLSMSALVAAVGKVSNAGAGSAGTNANTNANTSNAPLLPSQLPPPLPQESDVASYLSDVLLPHCIRLCLYEPLAKVDKKSSSSSASSKGAPQPTGNESSILWESTKPGRSGLKVPLPDPCVPLKYHSEEAVANAFALLRRVRLSRAIQFVVGGGVSRRAVLSFLQGPVMRGGMDRGAVPVWWCPWVHDLAVLIHAARYGLFSILQDRNDQVKLRMMGSVFERNTLERYISTVFVEGMEGQRTPALPTAFLRKSTRDELEGWVRGQAGQFPSANVLERRMALICAEMTKGAGVSASAATAGGVGAAGAGVSANASAGANASSTAGAASANDVGNVSFEGGLSYVYRNIPMFDHGGWPING